MNRSRLAGLSFYGVILLVGASPSASFAAEPQKVKVPAGDGRTLDGFLFAPPAKEPIPAVLVLHTKGGLEPADLSYAEDLARAGFVSLAAHYLNPEYQLQDPRYIEDLARVVDYLQARPEVQGRPVGVVGFSLGSKGVSLAARHPGIKAVVGYYGVYDLRILPQAKGRARYPTMPVDVAGQVGAPVLLLHGEHDDETPLSQAESMRDAFLKAGKVVELVVYPGAYHRFDRGPAPGMRGDRSREGYTYRLDAKVKEDAWNRTVSWFRKHLTGTP
jgi:dienelactone hydrolase